MNVKSILLAKGPVDDAPCGRFPPGPLERLSVRWWYWSLGPAYKTARVRPGTSTPRPWDGSHARTVVGSSSPPISRYFYKPKPMRTLAEIQTDNPARGHLSVAAFTHRVAERLHAEDPRWGRRVNVTGPISDDTVAYRVGISPLNPLSADIVFRAHTARARLQWHVAGRIGGTWITP